VTEPTRLSYFYVAFIDILGFGEMVTADCHSPNGKQVHVHKLRAVHEGTRARFINNVDYQLTQFSDSVVIARRYHQSALSEFLDVVRGFQRDLFRQSLLCRGAVACGKHLLEGSFMFSGGLLEAYRLEREIARYPRIVVSENLLQLVVPSGASAERLPVLKGDDGAWFLDYLGGVDVAEARGILTSKLASAASPGVREKVVWLCRYFDQVTNTNDPLSPGVFAPA
jgi:hypothetical protein